MNIRAGLIAIYHRRRLHRLFCLFSWSKSQVSFSLFWKRTTNDDRSCAAEDSTEVMMKWEHNCSLFIPFQQMLFFFCMNSMCCVHRLNELRQTYVTHKYIGIPSYYIYIFLFINWYGVEAAAAAAAKKWNVVLALFLFVCRSVATTAKKKWNRNR